MDVNIGIEMEKNMTPCKDCIVDMICTQKCPNFIIDLDRLQTDEMTYLRRCMNNVVHTFHISFNVTVTIRRLGIYWHKNGKQHRDNDQPAVIRFDGSNEWYKNGRLHRDNDKPAEIRFDGIKGWYTNGKLHRDNDQPAIIYNDGSKAWYTNGKLHRDNDQPAVIWESGSKEWYKWYKNGEKYDPL